MYKRKLRNTASRQSRGGANYYAIDDLEASTMELESMDEFNQIIFERDEYFRVKSTEISKCKPGDIVIRIGGIEVFDIQGGADALKTLVESQGKWPLTVELRLGSKLAVKQQPVISTRSTILPQIPHALISSSSSSSNGSSTLISSETEIDLTLEDEDDDDKVQIVDGPSGSTTASYQMWSKGQVVRTVYGVGSVVDSTNEKLTVMLHWNGLSELSQSLNRATSGDDKQQQNRNVYHPIAYLNRTTPVTDCAKEVVMMRGDFSLNRAEFSRFQSGMYLNDTIIDLFLHHLVYEKLPFELSQRCHVMTTHFFSQLDQQRFNQVASWTKNVDIFLKDFVLIPVNEANHWSLAILCFLNRLVVNKKSSSNIHNQQSSSPVMMMIEGENGDAKEVNLCTAEDEGDNDNKVEFNSVASTVKKKNNDDGDVDDVTADRDVSTISNGGSEHHHQQQQQENEEEQLNNKRQKRGPSTREGQKRGRGRVANELKALLGSNDNGADESDLLEDEEDTKNLKTPAKKIAGKVEAEEPTTATTTSSSTRSKRTVKKTKRLVDEMLEEDEEKKQKKQQQKRPQSMSSAKKLTPNSSDNSNSMITVEDEVDDTPEMPIILKLDSTKSHESKDVAKNLRLWIQQEYARRKKSNVDEPDLVVDSKTLPIVPPKVPLQSNSCDCGVFVVVFAEKFLNDQQTNSLKATVKQVKRRLGKQFGSEWFPLSDIQKKRMEMAQLVQQWGNVKL